MNQLFLNVMFSPEIEASVVLFAASTAILVFSTMAVIYSKAGENPWTSIIPFYNHYILCKICGAGNLLFYLGMIPVLNIFIGIILLFKLGEKFGKSGLFSLAMFFFPFVFLPILALGNAEYKK